MVNRVAFELLGIEIYWYALIIVSGIIVAMWLSTREAVRVGMKKDDVSDFVLVGIPVAFLGARIYYIVFNIQPYLNDPVQVFNIRSGGLAIYGGLIAGGIWLYFFCQRHFINTWTFLDIATPGILLAQAMGRWGNFMNQEAFGEETTRVFLEGLHLPKFIIDNMYIEGAYRQPTFLYESVWNFLGFIFLIFLRKKYRGLKQGEVALGYVIWYSFGRFFIEGMRTDSLYFLNLLRVSQMLSLILFVGAVVLLIIRRKQTNLKNYDRTKGFNQSLL